MNNNQELNGDEIDVFGLIETLWDGRMILVSFFIAATAIACLLVVLVEPKYITNATYEIDPKPPFVSADEVDSDISRAFFDSDNFARWKDGRPGTMLTVDLIDQRELINGEYFDVSPEGKFVQFKDNIF